ncbi:MAG: S1C family serine protease [Dehalococcoidia bacterium]
MQNGTVERGFLGVSLSQVSPELASTRNLQVEEGAGVQEVTPGSAADQAGLRAGDVIIKVGDSTISNVGDVTNALANHKPGEKVKVEYVRNGQRASADVTLGERPAGTE